MHDQETGYVIDVPYTTGFYAHQAPLFFAYTCALNEVWVPSAQGALRYLELGCGNGLTLNVLAAANPEGRFVGVDMNPAHIAAARSQAASLGLENVTFLEDSFHDYLEEVEPEAFDYISLHGIYSWIAAEARMEVVRIAERSLVPGGALYVSYNTMPGWSYVLPIREMFVRYAATQTGSSVERLRKTRAFLDKLMALPTGYFARPEVKHHVQELAKKDLTYVAHEYLNSHWYPLYSADVRAEMAQGRLSYVGQAEPRLNMPGLLLSRQALETLEGGTQDAFFQTGLDYLLGTRFRRDIFVKGPRPCPDWRERYAGLAVVRDPRESGGADAYHFRVLRRPLDDTERWLLAAAADEPRPVLELIDQAPSQGLAPRQVLLRLVMLVAASRLLFTHAKPADPGAAVAQQNQLLLGQALRQRRPCTLVSPATGSALQVRLLEALLLSAREDSGTDERSALIAAAAAQAQRLGLRLQNQAGQPIQAPAPIKERLNEVYDDFERKTLPLIRSLAIPL
jgi:SAM-dependent methyltransferase